jgi:hypothetical protein
MVIAALLGFPMRDGQFAGTVLQLAVLFAIPVIFRRLDHGDLSPGIFYAAWWAIGLLIPVCQEMCRTRLRVLQSLPWLSLILHVSILHYVYNVSFYAADAAPLLLAMAFILHQAEPSMLVPRKDLLGLRVALPIAAVLVSLGNPLSLCVPALSITPTRLAVSAAYLTYVLCFGRAYLLLFVVAGSAVIPAWIFGPTLDQVTRACWSAWDRVENLVDDLIPKTTFDWGVAAIGAAFAFLGMGALVSLARRIQLPSPDQSDAEE